MVSGQDILSASILIVDDQESNVSLLTQLLSEGGYTQWHLLKESSSARYS